MTPLICLLAMLVGQPRRFGPGSIQRIYGWSMFRTPHPHIPGE
jgi:hypothetical protein